MGALKIKFADFSDGTAIVIGGSAFLLRIGEKPKEIPIENIDRIVKIRQLSIFDSPVFADLNEAQNFIKKKFCGEHSDLMNMSRLDQIAGILFSVDPKDFCKLYDRHNIDGKVSEAQELLTAAFKLEENHPIYKAAQKISNLFFAKEELKL